jgi:hypothetical protein
MLAKSIMVGSSLVLGALGLVASFAPEELLGMLSLDPTRPLPLLIQLLGAGYAGLALSNWFARDSAIGGIYGRPLAMGNGLHFLVAAIALAKAVFAGGAHVLLGGLAIVYAILALAFGWLLFGTNGLPKTKPAPANERP